MAVNGEKAGVVVGQDASRANITLTMPQTGLFGNGAARDYLPRHGPMPDAPTPPVHYACQRCANCCRWPGFVRLDHQDITALAAHLGLSEHDFIQRYTRLRPQRDGLALTDQANGACVFLDGRDCRVQPVKPLQCQGFPNTWTFPGWREVCEAVPVHPK